MNDWKRRCFVIMPFRPELHYFYLFLKQHIENTLGIACQRADDTVLTIPILDKINLLIDEADVIVADCSGRNANVFYELGIAHALGKRVILIMSDPVQEAPTDIRHREFIRYKLDDHVSFLERLDKALRAALFESFEPLYQRALEALNRFSSQTHTAVAHADREQFLRRLAGREIEEVSDDDLLLIAVAENTSAELMAKLVAWYSRQRGSQ